MTSDECRRFHGDLAALVLGRLDASADAAIAVQAHLDGCPACRLERRDLESLASLLPLAELARLDDTPAPSADLATRIAAGIEAEIAAEIAAERRRRRRTRRGRVAAGIVAVAAVVTVAFGLASMLGGGEPRPPMREFAISTPGTSGHFALRANPAGTTIDVDHHGLDPDERYWLWLTDSSGKRVSAGTFSGAAISEPLVLQAALPLDDAARIWITDADDHVILDSTL